LEFQFPIQKILSLSFFSAKQKNHVDRSQDPPLHRRYVNDANSEHSERSGKKNMQSDLRVHFRAVRVPTAS